MKKHIIVITLLISCFFSDSTKAQSGFSADRLVFGGNFGASFSNYETLIGISPSVGYKVTDRLTLGTGVIYQFYRYKIAPFDFKFNNYGGRLYGTFQLNEFLILHSEYESLNLEYIKYNTLGVPDGTQRRTIGSMLVGGGYRQYISSNSMLDLMVLYNLTETPYTPYSNPIIRVGLSFGL